MFASMYGFLRKKKDPYNKVLLHMDGINGSTAFLDSATGKIFTTYVNAQISTAQTKFNQSGYFDGSSYIKTPYSSDLNFGTGDYTIDFWLKTTQTGNGHYVFDRCDGPITAYDNIAIQVQSGELRLLVSNLAGNDYVVIQSTSGSSINNGNWHHAAVVRNSGVTNIYIDGVSKCNFSTAYNVTFTTSLRVGGNEIFSDFMNGYLDEFRWSTGIARWTTTFTPPTSPY